MSSTKHQNLDKLLFIDPEVLLANIQNLMLLPQKAIQSNESLRNKYMRMITNGVISHDDLQTMLQTTGSPAMVSDIEHLLEIYGFIFCNGINIDGSAQYTIPYFISDPSSQKKPSSFAAEFILYMQFFSHIPGMLYHQLVFGLVSESENRNVAMQHSAHSTLTHMGYNISIEYHKLKDRILIGLHR